MTPGLSTAAAQEAPPARPAVARALLLAFLAPLCLLPLLWPGDAPWINDEPLLITNAYRANQAHTLAVVGLEGTHGVRYGPLPTWLYQAFLLISHDLRTLVVVRAALTMGATALALFLLVKALGLRRGHAAVVLLSPYLWFYSRAIWDNTFAIPLCALALGAYAWFLARRSPWALGTTLLCLVTLPLIHLMALALVAPLALHLLVFERAALWRYRTLVLLIALASLGVCWPYLSYLLKAGRVPFQSPPSTQGWWFPLLGGRYLSAFGLEYFLGSDWKQSTPLPGSLLDGAVLISGLAYVMVWSGILLAASRVVRAIHRGQAAPLDHVSGLALTILAAQCLLDGRARVFFHPHYYNATWIAFAVFSWLTVDALAKVPWLRWIPGLQAAALAVVVVSLILRIHASGGTRDEHYGPTLGNQLEIASALKTYAPDSPLFTSVANYQRFPHALATLRLLDPPEAGAPLRQARLRIAYTSADPHDGHVALLEEPLP